MQIVRSYSAEPQHRDSNYGEVRKKRKKTWRCRLRPNSEREKNRNRVIIIEREGTRKVVQCAPQKSYVESTALFI